MRRVRSILPNALLAVSFALLLSSAVAQPHAEPIHLPVVMNGVSSAATLVHLAGGDNSEVSAAVAPAGCVFVATIDRDDGNLIHVNRDDGDHLTPVDMPVIQTAGSGPALRVTGAVPLPSAPSFVPPGEKHASMSMLISGGQLVLYYTSRPEGATSGPFAIYRLAMPVPPCA